MIYDNNVGIQWCPGCPNHLILKSLKDALILKGLKPNEICLVSGIGQAAKLPHYLKCNFFNGLHGRALPVATGIAVSNPELNVIVTTGEGDCYGEGGNHFIHAIRRNPNITLLVHNNSVYALTKGQASPTTPPGERRTLQIKGVVEKPLNPMAIAIAMGCGFVARGFALDVDHLTTIIAEAISYRGFALVDIIQPCITWDPRPLSWFKERVVKVDKAYEDSAIHEALNLAIQDDEIIRIGIFYRKKSAPVFGEAFYKNSGFSNLLQPPVQQGIIDRLLSSFKNREA